MPASARVASRLVRAPGFALAGHRHRCGLQTSVRHRRDAQPSEPVGLRSGVGRYQVRDTPSPHRPVRSAEYLARKPHDEPTGHSIDHRAANTCSANGGVRFARDCRSRRCAGAAPTSARATQRRAVAAARYRVPRPGPANLATSGGTAGWHPQQRPDGVARAAPGRWFSQQACRSGARYRRDSARQHALQRPVAARGPWFRFARLGLVGCRRAGRRRARRSGLRAARAIARFSGRIRDQPRVQPRRQLRRARPLARLSAEGFHAQQLGQRAGCAPSCSRPADARRAANPRRQRQASTPRRDRAHPPHCAAGR